MGELTPLVIVGAGGHGREVLDIVEALNALRPTWQMLGFLSEGGEDVDQIRARGAEVLGPASLLGSIEASYVVAIGESEARARVATDLRATGMPVARLVHPASVVRSGTLGAGTVVAAGAEVGAESEVGAHVHLNVNAVVGESVTLGECATLSPGVVVEDRAHIGARVFLGAGVVVRAGRRVGEGSVVGAGAVVDRDVPAGVTAVGIPLRLLGPAR